MKAELVTLVKNLRAYRGYSPTAQAFVVPETQTAAKVIEELAARVEMLEKEVSALRPLHELL